jgi:hypothetical protein
MVLLWPPTLHCTQHRTLHHTGPHTALHSPPPHHPQYAAMCLRAIRRPGINAQNAADRVFICILFPRTCWECARCGALHVGDLLGASGPRYQTIYGPLRQQPKKQQPEDHDIFEALLQILHGTLQIRAGPNYFQFTHQSDERSSKM